MSVKHFFVTSLAVAAATSICVGADFAPARSVGKGAPVEGRALLALPAKGHDAKAPSRLGERNPLKPPFVEVFDDYPEGAEYETFEQRFQIINANGDTNPSGSDRSWGYYNYAGESNGRLYSKCAYLQYPYNRSVCDDWLIPRAIRLEAGKYYRVTVDASLYTEGKIHRFEVKMGEYNDAEGLNVTVIEPVDVTSTTPTQYEGWFKPEYDGIHYMGIHGISDKTRSDGGYLFMDNISMEAPRSGKEPSRVTDVAFVSDPDGTPSAEISFKVPEVAIDGSALTGPVTVVVKRGDLTIHNASAAPGTTVTVNDAVDAASMQTYTFTASNDAGSGGDLRLTNFIGMTTPLPPSITAAGEAETGKVRLAWDAPATDVNGTAINPARVSYNIYEVTPLGVELRTQTMATLETVIDMMIPAGEQKAPVFAVTSVCNGLESDKAVSDVVFVGTPYAIPYANSFVENNEADVVLSTTSDEGVSWRMLDDYSDPKPQDGDGGYVAMIGSAPGQYGELSTGKIDLSDATDPYVSFYTYTYDLDENVVSVLAVDCATGERIAVSDFTLADLGAGVGWKRVICPLKGCAGKVVRVIVAGRIETHAYIMIDNMVIGQLPQVDLAISDVDYTRQASAGEAYAVIANVANLGSKTVETFTVTLYCDGETVTSLKSGPIEPGETMPVVLRGAFSAVSPEMPAFNVEVTAEGEENPDDNMSATFNITFLAPLHPVAEALQAAESEDGSVMLSWSAPDMAKAAPEESLEDFESYPSYSTQLNGFTLMDADGGFPAGLQGVEMPIMNQRQSFWTIGNDVLPFMSTLGTTSLATMASVNADGRPVSNDDWLISPELYGGRQTISFWACSQTVDYGNETFEVYASTTGNDLAEFSKVLYETEVGDTWTQFFVTLTAGTKYFAIRCTSDDRMIFTLDDISFIAKGTPRTLDFQGYNIYRNGVMLNSTPVTATSFSTSRELERDDYFVTAVYAQGESTASNVVSLGVGGVDGVEADSAPSQEAVYFDLHGIRVNPSSLTPGIYLRRQGTGTEKIVIR